MSDAPLTLWGGRVAQREREVPIAEIEVGDRLRDVTEAAVADMMVSIREVGLQQPIVLRVVERQDGEIALRLVIGLHRLEATRRLGAETIRARVVEMTDLDARQAEIDENMIRCQLNPLEFGVFARERVEVYAERHPEELIDENDVERRRGRPARNFLKLGKFPGKRVRTLMGFAEEVAAEGVWSRSTIYAAIQQIAGLQDILPLIRGTWIAENAAVLRQLAAFGDAGTQAQVVEQLLSGRTRNVAAARAYAAGAEPAQSAPTPVSDLRAAFDKLWRVASAAERADLVESLAGRKLPGEWALIPSAAPEFQAFRARMAPPAKAKPSDFLQGFDEVADV